MRENHIAARICRIIVLWAVCLVHAPARSAAGDWPQILGPNRTGHATDEKLAGDWSQTKPTLAWSVDVGQGYAGPSVVDGKVLIFHRNRDVDVLDCVSAESGKKVWSADWKAAYRGGIDSDKGPRCVPTVQNGMVFVLSAGGDVHCVRLQDGEKVWTRKLGRETKALDGYFGFGSSPIVIGDILLVNIGGKEDNSIVGLDIKTGEPRWNAHKDGASYAAPIERKLADGSSTAIFISRLTLLELNPTNGAILFQTRFGATGPTVNAATPLLLDDDRLFVTASYRIGAKCLSLKDPDDPKPIWESDDVLSSQYPTPVYANGHLFGVHGREDGAPASLRCVDATDGKVVWKKDSVGMAHLIASDGKLLQLTTKGELALLKLSTEAYAEQGRVRVSNGTTRALPALSNGRVFLRDTNGKLMAWQLP